MKLLKQRLSQYGYALMVAVVLSGCSVAKNISTTYSCCCEIGKEKNSVYGSWCKGECLDENYVHCSGEFKR